MGNIKKNDEHYLKTELYNEIQIDSRIFEFIQESSLDGIWYWDLSDPDNQWISPKFWKLLGYNPEEKRHSHAGLQDVINPDDLRILTENIHNHCQDPSHPFDQVLRYTHKDGNTIWIRSRGMAICNDNGKPVRILGVNIDITAQKEKEGELQNLIKEMNHRIKNNLAMISSLISIKEMSPDTEGCRAAFIEIRNNIDAIGLLHEKLYQSATPTDINFREYSDDLLSNIFSNYIHGKVNVINNISGCLLDVKKATVLGLIINETATNAMKHGFVPEKEAVFKLEMANDKNTNQCSLKISNNGRVFPENIDINSSDSYGIRILQAFVIQLKGNLRLIKKPQTTIIIEFPGN